MTNLLNKWRDGLARTRKTTFGRLATVLGVSKITPDTWDEMEALLIQADLGISTTQSIINSLKDRVSSEGLTQSGELSSALREELRTRLDAPPPVEFLNHPTIILVVGVNGSGKTTNIAKLGKRFSGQGLRVILGAADTYRAAAVDQL